MNMLLGKKYGIAESIVMTEDSPDQYQPTKENIITWIKWLVSDNQPGDVLWLHYSGHGYYEMDYSQDEVDHKDETIIPLDGHITDDLLNEILCKPVVESGAVLYFHDDCCHSGTGADLKYRLKESTKTTHSNYYDGGKVTDIYEYLYNEPQSYSYYSPYSSYSYWPPYMYGTYGTYGSYNYYNRGSNKELVSHTHMVKSRSSDTTWEIKEDMKAPSLTGPGKVVKWSGCKDDQTSADGFNGMANGAMTGSVILALNNNKFNTWGEFLGEIRTQLKNKGFTQVPQLGFSCKVNYDEECFPF
jgi:hypothetical protein